MAIEIGKKYKIIKTTETGRIELHPDHIGKIGQIVEDFRDKDNDWRYTIIMDNGEGRMTVYEDELELYEIFPVNPRSPK